MSEVNVLEFLIGEVAKSVYQRNDDEMYFELENGKTYRFYHEQDCCESVYIEDIVGDLSDLIGAPVLQAEEVTESGNDDEGWGESITWTFYKFATIKGSVTVRWYGSSNGYYSETVYYEEVYE